MTRSPSAKDRSYVRWHRAARASGAGLARDLGLLRISRLTRWAVAGAIALTGVFSEVAAHAWSGHSRRAQSSTVRHVHSHTSTAGPSSSSSEHTPATPDLQTPEQVPQPSAATTGAVS